MSILSGIRKQKKYITDANGDHTLVSEWTNTDTVDLATDIVNNEHTLAEATEWDDTYDDVSTQPTGMSELVSKMTTTFNNTKYLQNQNEAVQEILGNLVDIAHPVGSLYWSNDSTDPSEIFPNTQWTRIKDRFIYAIGDTGESGQPGGQRYVKAKISDAPTSEVKLTVDHLPSHRHYIPALSGTAVNGGGHTHTYDYPNWEPAGGWSEGDRIETHNLQSSFTMYKTGNASGTGANEGAHSHSVSTNPSNTDYTGRPASTILGHQHKIDAYSDNIEIMPPYEQYYCWIRTA